MLNLQPPKDSLVEKSSSHLAIQDWNSKEKEFLNFGDTCIREIDEITQGKYIS